MPAKRAVVVGGGFIGLEMMENLIHRGLDVTLIERLNQVMPPLDPEMARLVERYMVRHGVRLELNDGVAGFEQSADGSLEVLTSSGKRHPADIVILAIGVRPETALAKMAGIELGERGGIRVDEQMRTSDPDILAVGDAVEVKDFVTGQWTLIPLAGPANRQGRIAADVIAGRDARFRGTQGTSICKIFEGVIASTGASEKTPDATRGDGFRKDLPLPEFARGVLPGRQIHRDQRSSSANPTDSYSVHKYSARTAFPSGSIPLPWRSRRALPSTTWRSRSCAMRRPSAAPRIPSTLPGWSRPMYSAVTCRSVHWDSVDGEFLLDVRSPAELDVEYVPGAVNIPLPELRARLGELPRDREILVFCRSGQRAYYATRILLQNGFQARNIAGGMLSHSHLAV